MDEHIVTTNLADFGQREIELAKRLLDALVEQGLPETFSIHNAQLAFNRYSGDVFLMNSEYECALLNGDRLEEWHFCPGCDREGFASDIGWTPETSLCGECSEKEG